MEGHIGVSFHHSTLYVGGFEVGGPTCIGPIGDSEGGDARSEVIGMVSTEGEVVNISVEGSGDNRNLKTKSGGASMIGKKLGPQDGHTLLFGGVGDDMPERWELVFAWDMACHEEQVDQFSPFSRWCSV
jgi:hypothetical protein